MRRLAPAILVPPLLGALLLAGFGGHGFLNYDTLYALVWGRDITHGIAPDYAISLAPTPHPLATFAGILLSPLSSAGGPTHGHISETLVEGLAYLWLGWVGYLTYRLGEAWFGRAAGVVAALIVLTREPVLDYGVRAYVDLPYIALVLGALLLETRRPRRGIAPLALLAVAGLLRPEAWLFAVVYAAWCWRGGERRAAVYLLAIAGPFAWLSFDLIVSGDPLHSLTGTRNTAATLGRITGIGNVPVYTPRRLGEILRVDGLFAAAGGGIITLLWRRERALLGAVTGVLAVVAFVIVATAGLPILTRYLLLPAIILAIFAGAGIAGWTALAKDDPHRRPWLAFAGLAVLGVIALAPSQVHRLSKLRDAVRIQSAIVGDLRALTGNQPSLPPAIRRSCAPVAVPNHRAVPNLALWLDLTPDRIVSAQEQRLGTLGTYVTPRTRHIAREFLLDKNDPVKVVPRVPPGFHKLAGNGSWIVDARCAPDVNVTGGE